jgi:peptide/nickel transport system substrate-binding protein
MPIDQVNEIFIAGELDIVETANWNPKVTRRDYMVGLENTGSAVVDDPDQQLCEITPAIPELVWDMDKTLQEEAARPVILHTRGATCWHPQVKGLTTMVNSMVNGWCMEEVWLDR